jgi:hypothetical protein
VTSGKTSHIRSFLHPFSLDSRFLIHPKCAHNSTTSLPEGTFNYGDPNLLYAKAKWTDVLLFYGVNYFAHALTVKSRPGERMADQAAAVALALSYPY